jgi:hypothetical protein
MKNRFRERSIRELLKVMLNNKQLFKFGLCAWIDELEMRGIISWTECSKLNIYIKENRPSMFSSLQAFRNSQWWFYWDRGDIKPRIKWINKHIKKLSK